MQVNYIKTDSIAVYIHQVLFKSILNAPTPPSSDCDYNEWGSVNIHNGYCV